MMQWQPIDTAPKDGSAFLSCDAEFYKETLCATFFDDECQWLMNFSYSAVRPTHWMPLPAPPTT